MRLTAIQAANPPHRNPSAVERGRAVSCVEVILRTERTQPCGCNEAYVCAAGASRSLASSGLVVL